MLELTEGESSLSSPPAVIVEANRPSLPEAMGSLAPGVGGGTDTGGRSE